MKKVLLFFIAINAICITSFSQVTKDDAIKAARTSQEKLLKNFKDKDKSVKLDWGEADEDKQFLIGSGKELKYGQKGVIKSTENIKNVYEKITRPKNNIKFEKFTYENPSLNNAKDIQGKGGRGKNQQTKIKAYDIVFDIKNCYTKLSASYIVDKEEKKSSSEANYDVTMTWHVELKSDKRNGQQSIKSTTLKSIKAKEAARVDLVDTMKLNKNNMNETATKLIKEWYKDSIATYFPNYMANDDQLVKTELRLNDNVVTDIPKTALKELKQEVDITVNIPDVRIYVAPEKYISSDSMYVKNPVAFYTFKAKSFKIKFTSDDYKTGELIEVNFTNSIFTGPQTIADNERVMFLAEKAKENILNTFTAYLANPNKENTDAFKALFMKNGDIEISVLDNSGVKRANRTITQYAERLKGAELDFERTSSPEVKLSDDIWTATFDFTQKIARDKYCDHTSKQIEMKLDENNAFKITRITVVNDATPCE